MALAESMGEWTDADGAAYRLAVELGAIDPDIDFPRAKWIFWTDNPLGNGLHSALIALAAAGILESNDGDSFRWNPQFELPS
ncbi:hypothetical protein JNW90_09995 [Micromonospora sp. STR1s_5]|nr:hypothetical protein [Micromonospora sp. STR1s_5]